MRYKLLILTFTTLQTGAAWQGNAAAAAQPNPSAAVAQKTSTSVPEAAPAVPPAVADQQSASTIAMLASVEKQKIAIKLQAGGGASTDSFFTAAWTSPATIPIPTLNPACAAIAEDDLKSIIAESAKTQDLKPELVRAVIKRESAFYACAVSEKGALGLMQLMPEVAQQFGVDALDPRQNVQGGSRYLKQLMTRYKGDLRLALAAYNAGPQRVDAAGKVPDIPETTAYVDAILKDLDTPPSPQP